MEAVLPGVDEQDLELSLTGSTLTIRARIMASEGEEGCDYQLRERLSGRFYRSITLPTLVEADQAAVVLENGILHLMLLKADEVRPKSIRVKGVAS